MDAPPLRKEYALELLGSRHEYADVRTFIFKRLEPFTFEAGQYIHMHVPGVKEGKAVREFSFASAPSEPELWFSMHVRAESPFKMRLAELVPGDTVTIFKIQGDFTYPASETREVVYVAGGIGATPFRSIVIERDASGLALPAAFIHVATGGYLYQDELQTKPFEQRRITRHEVEESLREAVARKPSALYYVAGSPFFAVTVENLLLHLGVSQGQIKRDDFDGYEGEA